MSLKSRIFWILAVVSLVLLIVTCIGLFVVMGRSLGDLEQVAVDKDVHRIEAGFKQRYNALYAFTADWAAWDDSYEFVEDGNADYIDSNLISTTFVDTPLNLIAFYRPDGSSHWSRMMDLEQETDITSTALPPSGLLPGHPVLTVGEEGGGKAGLWATDHGPMILASHPILNSEGDGPSRGSLVMGLILTRDWLAELSEQIQIPFDAWQLGDNAIPADVRPIIRKLSPGKVFSQDRGLLEPTRVIYTILPDLSGKPLLIIRATIDRSAFTESMTTLLITMGLLVLIGAAVLGIMHYLLHRSVVAPLSVLTGHVVQLGETGDLHKQVSVENNDELGLISREINKMQEKIARLAHYDLLTGLANRMLFMDRAEQALQQARREKSNMGIVFIDLDRFKAVNDSYGHDAGDYLLQQVAKRLQSVVRASDTVARLGGDEFAITLHKVRGREEVAMICEKLVSEITPDMTYNGQVLQPACSIGACIFPDSATNVDTLLKCADEAMYTAKKSGSNQVHINKSKAAV